MANLISLTMLDSLAGTAKAVLDAALSAGETFQGSRKPSFTAGPGLGVAPVAVAAVGPVILDSTHVSYVLTFPSPVENQANGGLWYVRTIAGGVGIADPLPVWMDASLIGLYTMGGRALRDIIIDNKPGLDVWLKAADQKLQFQASVYGADWNASQATPGALVKPYTCNVTYEEMPRGRLTVMSYQVTCIIRNTDAANEADAIGQFMEGLERILNQACYETYQFEDGTLVNGGQSDAYQFSDDILEDVWASQASFIWTWESIRYTA